MEENDNIKPADNTNVAAADTYQNMPGNAQPEYNINAAPVDTYQNMQGNAQPEYNINAAPADTYQNMQGNAQPEYNINAAPADTYQNMQGNVQPEYNINAALADTYQNMQGNIQPEYNTNSATADIQTPVDNYQNGYTAVPASSEMSSSTQAPEKKKKGLLPLIIVASAAVVIIGGLLAFTLITISNKNSEIEQKNNEIAMKSEEIAKKTSELDEKQKELAKKENELNESREQNRIVTAERDKLKEEDEARKKAEADTSAADNKEKAAISQLIGLMENVDELTLKFQNFSIDQDGGVDEAIRVLAGYRTELEDYLKQFKKIEGLPKNFYDAGKDYFETADVLLSEYQELVNFLTGYSEYVNGLSEYVSLFDDFTTLDYTAPEKINNVLTAVENTKCPLYMEALWERVKGTGNLMSEVAGRIVRAYKSEDFLQMYSALNLFQRFSLVLTNIGSDLGEIIDDEDRFNTLLIENNGKILNEIYEAQNIEYADRKNYVFKSLRTGEIDVDYRTIDTIYPSLYNSYDHFAVVELGCYAGSAEVIVECEIPGLTQKIEHKYHIDSRLQPIYIKPAAAENIKNLDNAWDSNIKISIKTVDGKLLDTKSFPVHIVSANDFRWSDDEFGVCTKDNILCYVTPESEAITKLKRDALDILTEITGGYMDAFVGYQGPTFTKEIDTYFQTAALTLAMSDAGVRYVMDPFSIDGADQHILFPSQVLEQQSGLCVETSLVIASALQSAQMHTYLVFPYGHAQVAVETWENSGEYFLIETTRIPCDWDDYEDYILAMAEGKDVSRMDSPIQYLSKDEWNAYIENYGVYLVDCSDGKLLGLTPFQGR